MTTQPEALRLAYAIDYPDVAFGIEAAAELRRLRQHELANEVWQVKTQWVQDTAKPEELGMHRADVMRQRLVRAETQRDALLEACKELLKVWEEDPAYGHASAGKARAAIAKAEEA